MLDIINEILKSEEFADLFITPSNEYTPLGSFAALCFGLAVSARVASIASEFVLQHFMEEKSDE